MIRIKRKSHNSSYWTDNKLVWFINNTVHNLWLPKKYENVFQHPSYDTGHKREECKQISRDNTNKWGELHIFCIWTCSHILCRHFKMISYNSKNKKKNTRDSTISFLQYWVWALYYWYTPILCVPLVLTISRVLICNLPKTSLWPAVPQVTKRIVSDQ